MSKVIDLFSGIGGLSEGFRMAGFDIVLANEIDKEIADSYKKNHLDTLMINEDITKLDINDTFSSYKDIDVIIGGPPCQDFSAAGKRVEAERADLTIDYANIISKIRPTMFVMENVDRIRNSAVYHTARNIYKKSGYGLTEVVLDASLYGVPQKRKRFFCIGKLNAEDGYLNDFIESSKSDKPNSR